MDSSNKNKRVNGLLPVEGPGDLLNFSDQLATALDKIKPNKGGTSLESNTSTNLKYILFQTLFSLAAGYVSRKIVERALAGPTVKALSGAVTLGVTSIVARNPERIKAMGQKVFNFVRSKNPILPDPEPGFNQ